MANDRRTARRVLAGLAGAAVCVGTIGLSGAPSGADGGARVIDTQEQALTLNPGITDNPLADATGRVHAVVNRGRTTVELHVAGVGAETGTTFPAHVHVGPCTSDLSAAGGHYNSGGPVDDEHESWVTFTVNGAGRGVGHDSDGFAIAPGDAQSIVVHRPSDGARLGCLPVDF